MLLSCAVQTIIPIGLRDRRQPATGVPDYTYRGDKQLNTTILFDPMSGMNASQPVSCPAMQADLPNGEQHLPGDTAGQCVTVWTCWHQAMGF